MVELRGKKRNRKKQALHIVSYIGTHIHTHTLEKNYFTQGKQNDCKRALAKNYYESCCSDKQTP